MVGNTNNISINLTPFATEILVDVLKKLELLSDIQDPELRENLIIHIRKQLNRVFSVDDGNKPTDKLLVDFSWPCEMERK